MKIGYEYMVGYADAMLVIERELYQQASYMTEEDADACKKLLITVKYYTQAADQAVVAAKRTRDRDKR